MFSETLEGLERELGIVVADPVRAVLSRQMPHASREELLAQLTNGQTYFFRHPEQCDAFEDYLRRSEPLSYHRIWSAGCSTGCEAYSIALMLDRSRRRGRVLGTDISGARIQEARAGVYRESRMLRLDAETRGRYFLPQEEGFWKVRPVLTELVSFELENLTLDTGPGMSRTWEVIFCRNVLIYFDEGAAREILQRLVSRLEMGGLLVLGFPEAFFGLQHPELGLLTARSAIFQKLARPLGDALDTPRPPLLPVAPAPGPFQEGLRLHAMGELEAARRSFQQAEEAEPGLSLVHYFSARLHDELHQKPLAVASLRKFFETYSDDDPRVQAFTLRNGLSLEQLNLAAHRLRERLDRGAS